MLAVSLLMLLGAACDSSSTDARPDAAALSPESTDLPESATASPSVAPEQVATEFVERWSRHDLAYQAWWATVRPLCSPRCRTEFAYTDPAAIPPLKLAGAPQVGRIENDVYTLVQVPTTIGTFSVAMTRPQAGTWKVSTMTFPDGFGP